MMSDILSPVKAGGAAHQSRGVELATELSRAPQLASWRSGVLRYILLASGFAHLGISALGAVFVLPPNHALLGFSFCAGALHLALGFTERAFTERAALLVLSLYAELFAIGLVGAWAPPFVLLALVLSVFGGLLLGRALSWLPPVGILLLFVVLTGLRDHGLQFHPGDIAAPRNWLRVASIYLVVAAIAAYAVRLSLRVLLQATSRLERSLREATKEALRLELIHRTLAEAEEVISAAKARETATEMLGAVRLQVGETVGVVRASLAGMQKSTKPSEVQKLAAMIVESVERTAAAVQVLLAAARPNVVVSLVPDSDSHLRRVTSLSEAAERHGQTSRAESLERALWIVGGLYALSVVGALALSPNATPRTLGFPLVACALSLWAWRASKWPYSLRVGLLFAVLFVPSADQVLLKGYMAPGATLALGATVLCAAVYADARVTWLAVLGTATVFVAGAFDPMPGPWQDMDVRPDLLANWWRQTFLFPFICLGLGRVLLDVPERILLTLGALDVSFDALDLARRDRERAHRVLLETRPTAQAADVVGSPKAFPSGALHELGNVLAAFLGWAEVLQSSEVATGPEVERVVEVLNQTAKHAEALLSRLAAVNGTGSATL